MQRFKSDFTRQWITFIAIISTFVVNALSNIMPAGGLTIGEISNTQFANVLMVPANYAFVIWGLIYLGLFAFGGYQVRGTQRHNSRLQRGGYGLAIACLFQIGWVIVFLNQQFVLSVVAMLGILVSLTYFYIRLGVGREKSSWGDRWFIDVPISIYLGWIAVATVVNVASALYSINWSGWGLSSLGWTVVMLIVTTAIALLVLRTRQDNAYTLVMIWAFVAIAIRQSGSIPIVATALSMALLLAIAQFMPSFQSIHQNDA
jgi:hypothetical protein